MELLDFRSDTVTKPTPEMREAMAQAEVGDDVYGEDPTVNKLQEIAADMLGKKAAIFVASGTMGNLTAMLSHCGRGDEIIEGNLAHTFLYEAGGLAALGGIHPHTIPNQPDGTLVLQDIRDAIRSTGDPHMPITRLVSLENTHNRCGGASISAGYTRSVGELAKQHGLVLHLDGARIFNAAVDQGVTAKELAAPADSVTFCLSKGLSAPVGSVLCGSTEFIQRAHRIRKQLGGGMRQAGILAAAGIVALQHMVERLSEDHRRARKLADGLRTIPGITLDVQNTNMVYFLLEESVPLTAEQFLSNANERGLLFGRDHDRRFRMVTHVWIDDSAVDQAMETLNDIVSV
jgi:threonine aldolase